MKLAIKTVSIVLQSFGVTLLFSPLFYVWFIHGNYERYIWIINGPKPFNRLGGGPNQFWLLFSSLLLGGAMIFLSYLLKRNKN